MRALTAPLVVAGAALLLAAPAAHAQGTLSTQGFGYPPGQISTRSQGAGAATAEIDPVSPLNPASLVNWGTSAVFFQASPEYRTIDIGGESQKSSTQRYPLAIGALRVGPATYLSLSTSTYLDRTWGTTTETLIDIGGATVMSTTALASQGAINDVRLAAAHAVRDWLRVGLGAHAIVGRNRLSVVNTFGDSSAFTPIVDTSTISYGAGAFSAGAEARVGEHWSVAASTRFGGKISTRLNDSTTLSRANMPTRFGVGVGYLGLRGSVLAVRAAHESWSNLSSLGQPGFTAHDGWDLSAGADVAGPRFGRNVVQLRAGVRRRTLPFEAGGSDVDENSFSLGAGTMFANGRVVGDIAVIRSSRTAADIDAHERAWTLSFGLAIQP